MQRYARGEHIGDSAWRVADVGNGQVLLDRSKPVQGLAVSLRLTEGEQFDLAEVDASMGQTPKVLQIPVLNAVAPASGRSNGR